MTSEVAYKNLIKVIEKSNSSENLLMKVLNKEKDPKEVVNIRDIKGRQAIHLACKKKKVEFLNILVHNGADISS